jgi:hypothetical protein
MMTLREEWDLFWECTLGNKSHLNIAGKAIGFPLFVVVACVFFGMSFLFNKRT